MPELLRVAGPLVLAVAAALYLDRSMERRGALPPHFDGRLTPDAALRRAFGGLVVASILWAGAFSPLAAIGEAPPDPAELTIPRLFLLHGLLVAALAAWYGLGYLPRRATVRLEPIEPIEPIEPMEPMEPIEPIEPMEPMEPMEPIEPIVVAHREVLVEAPGWRQAFALAATSVRRELRVGLTVGVGIWMLVLLVLLLLAGLVSLLGGRDALPAEPPSLVLWIGALPILARAAIALSAGIVEEIFFRGFLQPRIGVLASTALFVLAHVGYGQPFMLVGVTMLSLLYAELARRRGSVWAPIAAHAVFDLVQLLVVVPLVSRALEHPEATERVIAGLCP